jgi:hypothetical protein
MTCYVTGFKTCSLFPAQCPEETAAEQNATVFFYFCLQKDANMRIVMLLAGLDMQTEDQERNRIRHTLGVLCSKDTANCLQVEYISLCS